MLSFSCDNCCSKDFQKRKITDKNSNENIRWYDRHECHDPDKVIFSYSFKVVGFREKTIRKRFELHITTIKRNYGDYMTPFKLFYRAIRKLPIEDHKLEKVKTD